MEEPQDTKEFGVGKAFLMSIQESLHNANSCFINGYYQGWRSHLDCIYRKISSKTNKEETKAVETVLSNVDTLGTKHAIQSQKDGKSGNVSKKTIIIGRDFVASLAEYEQLIIKVLDRLGWLIPKDKEKKRPR